MNECDELLLSSKNAMRTLNFVPNYTQDLCKMGLNWFATIKLFLFGCSVQKQFVGLNCFDLTICSIACYIQLIVWSTGVPKCLT